ncbi:hypothetical protein BB560_003227, partial [Smittium megazygosporum]
KMGLRISTLKFRKLLLATLLMFSFPILMFIKVSHINSEIQNKHSQLVKLGQSVLLSDIADLTGNDDVVQEKNYIYSHSKENKARAAFVGLVKNSERVSIMRTIRQIEDRFNKNFNYPIILLNNEEFTSEFKESVQAITNSKVYFGHVRGRAWSYPSWINQTKARIERETSKYVYGKLESYRLMCRFQSGYIFRHPLLRNLDYYWRIEPGVDYFCDIDYDPFQFMRDNRKMYGFVITVPDGRQTIRTLWDTTKKFIETHPQYLNREANINWIMTTNYTYNTCHYWTNFEIADLSFYRSKTYMDYFNYLDQAGGFFYERWGDAPVHTLATSLFLRPDQIHYFNDIGYRHEPVGNCPAKSVNKKCVCDSKKNYADRTT